MLTYTTAADPLDRVSIVGDNELPAVADQWNVLAGDVAFRRHEWLATWWQNYRAPGEELFAVALHDATGALAGLAPWYLARRPWSGRVIRFLGTGKVCSEYLTVLCRGGAEAAVARRLAEWLVDEAGDRWDMIELAGVDPGDAMVAELVRQMKLHGYAVHQRQQHCTWRLQLPDTWDEFLAGLSSKRRSRVRAAQRRMLDRGHARVESLRSAAEVATGLEILKRLHEQRRQNLDGGGGCFSTPRFSDFLHATAERFAAIGRLRLDWLQLGGRPAAVELKLLGGDTVYYYQTGMDPTQAEQSPGWLLQIASLRLAIDEGYRWFDFLRGDEGYKANWRARPFPLTDVRIIGRRTSARWRHGLWLAGSRAKQWFRTRRTDLTPFAAAGPTERIPLATE